MFFTALETRLSTLSLKECAASGRTGTSVMIKDCAVELNSSGTLTGVMSDQFMLLPQTMPFPLVLYFVADFVPVLLILSTLFSLFHAKEYFDISA